MEVPKRAVQAIQNFPNCPLEAEWGVQRETSEEFWEEQSEESAGEPWDARRTELVEGQSSFQRGSRCSPIVLLSSHAAQLASPRVIPTYLPVNLDSFESISILDLGIPPSNLSHHNPESRKRYLQPSPVESQQKAVGGMWTLLLG